MQAFWHLKYENVEITHGSSVSKILFSHAIYFPYDEYTFSLCSFRVYQWRQKKYFTLENWSNVFEPLPWNHSGFIWKLIVIIQFDRSTFTQLHSIRLMANFNIKVNQVLEMALSALWAGLLVRSHVPNGLVVDIGVSCAANLSQTPLSETHLTLGPKLWNLETLDILFMLLFVGGENSWSDIRTYYESLLLLIETWSCGWDLRTARCRTTWHASWDMHVIRNLDSLTYRHANVTECWRVWTGWRSYMNVTRMACIRKDAGRTSTSRPFLWSLSFALDPWQITSTYESLTPQNCTESWDIYHAQHVGLCLGTPSFSCPCTYSTLWKRLCVLCLAVVSPPHSMA